MLTSLVGMFAAILVLCLLGSALTYLFAEKEPEEETLQAQDYAGQRLVPYPNDAVAPSVTVYVPVTRQPILTPDRQLFTMSDKEIGEVATSLKSEDAALSLAAQQWIIDASNQFATKRLAAQQFGVSERSMRRWAAREREQ